MKNYLLDQIRNRMELRGDVIAITVKNYNDIPFWFWEEIKGAGYEYTLKGETLVLKLIEF